MNVYEIFCKKLELLEKAEQADLTNELIQHGIVHVFAAVFDAGQDVFRQRLQEDGMPDALTDTPKELLMDAYEAYLFVDEDVWLSMLRDRYHPDRDDNDRCTGTARAGAICTCFRRDEDTFDVGM